MAKWPALSLAVMSTVICLAGDYGIQSRAAGMQPGDMSLRDYGATISARITRMQSGESPDSMMAASKSFFADTDGAGPVPGDEPADTGPAAVRVNKGLGAGSSGTCVRRGTILDCN